MRILIAEDDPRLLKSLVYIFQTNHFTVTGVENGKEALDHALSGTYDGLVLDIMMPGLDGLTLLGRLREAGVTTPALFLTARTEVHQRIEGLDVGADDYLAKPFSVEELLARVRAMLRRRDSFTPDLLRFHGVALDRTTHELSCGGSTTPLSGKEYQMMEYLLENPRRAISTEQFIVRIWGWDTSVDTSVIWVHTSNLRKKLAAIGAPVRIRLLRGAGYILEESDD